MSNSPEDSSYEVERFTALEEASAHFGIVLRSLYDTFAEDVTVDEMGKQELVLMNRSATTKSAKPNRTYATLSRPSNEILPSLAITAKDNAGVTTHRHYDFEELVYVRTESRSKRDPISGQEVPQFIDPDNIESHDVTAEELEDTLKFMGTLVPKRVLIAEYERRYDQSHGLKAFVQKYLLGKRPR